MTPAPEAIRPQKNGDSEDDWKGGASVTTTDSVKSIPAERLIVTDVSSSGDEVNVKVRKPYTITKQRERWSEDEHRKFLEALKLYGRAWRKIEEHIGTKTAVQIRSHAQKFFSKIERGVPAGNLAAEVEEINIPPPRPKRKPSHPYPKKAGYNPSTGHPATPLGGTATTESVALTTSIDKGAAASVHDIPLTTAYGPTPQGDVKLFGKRVIVPLVPALVSLRKNSVEEDGILQSPDIRSTKANLSALPSPKVQMDLSSVTRDTSPLHTNANNSGTTSVEGTDESVVEVSTNGPTGVEEASAVDSYPANVGKCSSKKLEAANQVDKSDVDAAKCTGLQVPRPDHHNPMYLWMSSLFHFYNRLFTSQFAARESGQENVINPMALWHLMQGANMSHSFQSGATNWPGLVAGSQGQTSNELCGLPLYMDGASFPPWCDSTAFVLPGSQCPSINTVCETEVGSTVNVYRTQPVNNIECIKEAREHEPLVGGVKHSSGMTNSNDLESSRRMRYLENGNEKDNDDIRDREIRKAENQQPAQERDSNKNQRQQNICTSVDEFDEGEKRSRDGSSSGSNIPLDGCQLSEAGTANDIERNNVSNSEKNYSELDSATDGSPKFRFKYIEKRKRNQQTDSKHASSEESKRVKGSGHEVSEQCRKAFQALFTCKTLPQTFPVAANKSVQRPRTCRSDAASDREGREMECGGQEGEIPRSIQAVKFSVSPRSGFMPYRQPLKVNCSV